MDIRAIRKWVERAKVERSGRGGYPPDLQEVVARHAAVQRQLGRTWASIKREVGLSSTTMRNWMGQCQPGGFHELQVIDDTVEPPCDPERVLTSPKGFTVTGCTIDDIARLLMVVG